MRPRINHLVITLFISNETHFVVSFNLVYFSLSLVNNIDFFFWHNYIVQVERKTSRISHTVAKVLNTVKESAGTCHTNRLDYIGNKTTQRLLGYNAIEESYFSWNNPIDDHSPNRCFYHTFLKFAIDKVINNNLYLCVEVTMSFIMSNNRLFVSIEAQSLAFSSRTDLGDIIET